MSSPEQQSGPPTGSGAPAPVPPAPAAPAPLVAGSDGSAALDVGDLGPRHTLRRRGTWRHLLAVFLPNRAISPAAMRVLIAAELVIALVIWFRSPFKVLPRPDEILGALRSLWMSEGLGPALWTSFEVNLGALG